MTEKTSAVEKVVAWINAGFPEGVPPKDHFALLALLKRSLSEDEVVAAALTILKNTDAQSPVTPQQIRDAIHAITSVEPNPEEIQQVSARLASVGWPLAQAH
jgi:Protein of unknown function (DUF3349)